MFLTVKQLDKSYDTKKVLHKIDFSVEKGEMLVILGPSGCGKSTLLSCLNGFETLDQGSIELEGQDITNLPPEERDFTTVFQSYSLFPHMNVLENIMYGLKFKKISRQTALTKAQKMLDLLRLTEYSTARIQELSGGQQQRVALGRSLIVEPKLLLLDEPLSNLDEKLRISMREEIRQVQKKLGMTMLFVTHDQQEAFAIADRILLLNQGNIQQIATGPTLYDQPNGAFALEFIGEANRLDQKKYIRPERIQLSLAEDGEGRITSRVFQGATIDYQVTVNEKKYQVTTLNKGELYPIGAKVALKFSPQQIK